MARSTERAARARTAKAISETAQSRATPQRNLETPMRRYGWLKQLVLVLPIAVGMGGCKRFERKHVRVEQLADLPYPSCHGQSTGAGELLAQEYLRSGPTHNDKHIVERYELRRRDCLVTVTVRQEWPLGTTDLEAVFDRELVPLRIWKRMTIPGLANAGTRAEIRRYELRTDPVGIKRREPDGHISFEQLKGGRPLAVIGPGRGLLSIWLRRAQLKPGQKRRELAIDVRALEKIEPVTLLREPDMNHPELGKIRVYTFYGRETVFADERDVVVGDLAGLRPDRLLHTPPPPPIPLFGPIDPVHTP